MRVMAMTAPLEPAYAMFEVPRKPLPPIEAMLMILPWLFLAISRATACMQKNRPFALVA